MRPFALASLLLIAMMAGQARADFTPHGGSGDRQDTDRCPVGSYLVGAKYRLGIWLDQIQIACARMDADGSVSEPAFPHSSRGGSGGGPAEAYCSKNKVVFGIEYKLTPDDHVRNIRLYCADRAATSSSEVLFGNTIADDSAAFGLDPILQNCGPSEYGQAATGITINSGRHVNGLGLMCGPLPLAVVALKNVYRNQPGSNDVCKNYGDEMEAMVDEAKSLDCTFLKTGGGWGNNAPGYWERSCKQDVHAADDKPWGNRVVLRKQLDECRKTASVVTTKPGTKTVTALHPTNVYPANDGQSAEICAMSRGDSGQFLGTKPGEANWVHVSGISGACGGKSGWVWNGGDLDVQ